MDTDLARTFLEVSRTRHFGRAATRLNLTQSAISARIRQLEDYLGCRLFSRDHHDVRLTAAGRRLLPHATVMVTSWDRARQEVAVSDQVQVSLSIGALASIWDAWLVGRVRRIRTQFRDTGFSLEVHSSEALLSCLLDDVVDLALMFEPPHAASLSVREVGSMEMILVSSHATATPADATGEDFVQTDWGASFSHALVKAFPGASAPLVRTNLGSVARDLLLHVGGAAYLPLGMVEADVRAKRLFRIEGTPVIDRTIFAVRSQDHEYAERLETLLGLLAD